MKLHQARAALSGLLAAKLAKEGFTAAEDALAHPQGGLFSSYSDGGDPDAVLAGLNSVWELSMISLRPWPVAVHLQPIVTGVMGVLAQADIRPEHIRQARIAVSSLAYRMHGSVPWTDQFTARLSAPYVTSVVLHDRRCWVDQFSAERIADESVARFARERVDVTEDAGLADGTARITLETFDGAAVSEYVLASKGEPTNPLSRAEIVDKFLLAGKSVLPPKQLTAALDLIQRLRDVPDIGELMVALRTDGSSPAAADQGDATGKTPPQTME